MIKRTLLAAFAALALLTLTVPASAQGNGTQTTKFDFEDWWFYNACCDEIVSFNGTLHLNSKVTDNGDGTVSYNGHVNTSGVKGVGQTTGIRYIYSEVSKERSTFTTATFCPATINFQVRARFVGTGKGGRECSQDLVLSFQVVLDENCFPTSELISVDIDCANGTELE
ncbi:MAG TPA: hypothetical protein VNA88_13340 [Candidatus Kapabacteria bacterium]|nr:hypothetical protein [Candidatus Kapabacteria bacterium]